MRSNNLIRHDLNIFGWPIMDIYCESGHIFCPGWKHLIAEYHYALPLSSFSLTLICDFVHTFRDLNTHSFHLHKITQCVTIWCYFVVAVEARCCCFIPFGLLPFCRRRLFVQFFPSRFLRLSSMMKHLKLKLHQLLFYKRNKTKTTMIPDKCQCTRNVRQWQTQLRIRMWAVVWSARASANTSARFNKGLILISLSSWSFHAQTNGIRQQTLLPWRCRPGNKLKKKTKMKTRRE